MAQQNGTVDVQRKNTGWTVIYIKWKKKKYKQRTEKKKKRKRKKKVATVATVPLATIAIVQNLKKEKKKKKKKDKVANQNGIVDKQWKTLYEQCKNTVEKIAQIDDWGKKKNTMNSTHYFKNRTGPVGSTGNRELVRSD